FADEKEKIKLLRKFKRNPFPKQISEILSIALFGKYALSDRAFYTFETIKNIDKACLFSFYQDADLLNKHKQLILPLFELRDDLLDICKNLELYPLIQRSNNTTALHIRRGDYVTNQHAAKYHGVLDISYYNHAMEYVERERGKQNFIIFSDDVRWAQKAFLENDNCYVINNSDYDFSAIDMYLMSLCKNNIIANSTYSWWGAWLNKYEDKLVISPKQWFLGNNETSLRNASWITL
ncbi:alpha-1,2-fucosyltransferase, partial [Salmonella enterica]|nr:alpha-1,2-fucosyltransferase [Salmonella enterica]